MRPTFTVMIGTKGRDTLSRAFESFARQSLHPGDQIIVGLDVRDQAHEMPVDAFYRLANHYRQTRLPTYVRVDAFTYAGEFSGFGIPQLNHALRAYPITGSHITTIGDDDIFTDRAFSTLRVFCERDQMRPVFSRFVAPNGWVLPDAPRFQKCYISGCNIMAPRHLVGLHPERNESTHDYDWMADILTAADRPPAYLNFISVIARPRDASFGDYWVCDACGLSGRAQRWIDRLPASCPKGHRVVPFSGEEWTL